MSPYPTHVVMSILTTRFQLAVLEEVGGDRRCLGLHVHEPRLVIHDGSGE